MKYWMFTFAFFFTFLSLGAALPGSTQPEEILPITRASYDFGYYAEQAELWKKQTVANGLDANAWINYYRAARYANMLSEQKDQRFDLSAIVGQMPKEMANTFEFNYILFMHENRSPERFGHLLKAHELSPERLDSYEALIHYHIAYGEPEQAKFFSKKLFAAGQYSPSLLAWNYNALASLEPNAILLTHGDNDSYPAWALQAAKGVRPDVDVINMSLLFHDEYRQMVFSELGLEQIDSAGYYAYQDLYIAIARRFLQQSERPAYLGTAVPEFIRNALADSLYLTGLAFKLSPQSFDNVAILKNNYEKRFLLDHLRIQLEADTGSQVAAQMNLNYLPALIMLHRHYEASGEQSKAAELEAMTMQVAREGGREAELQKYFQQKTPQPDDFLTTISAKTLDKSLVKIRQGLFALETEVTNGQYEAFLMDLVKNKEFELLEKCKAPKVDWRAMLPEGYAHLTDEAVFKNGHPDDADLPIQNISYEAAQEYCRWITKAYNQSTEKRKAHQQVLFRLPTEAEWEMAASAKHAPAPYPWGGYFYRNEKGCFLSNFDVADEEPCDDCNVKPESNDGGFFPVKADAYFPNDFGLYNASGNVAEMVAEPGIAKGGSWADPPENCTVTARQLYDAPSPEVGFRVFMEVK